MPDSELRSDQFKPQSGQGFAFELLRKPHRLATIQRLAGSRREFLKFLIPCNLRDTSALAGFRPVPRVRIPPSPPRSLDCRESSPLLPSKYAKHARISRFFTDKPDYRERTARHQIPSVSWLFSRRHIRSPVSSRALGECNAIRSWGVGHNELTLLAGRRPIRRFP
jgi:hypothetical protein